MQQNGSKYFARSPPPSPVLGGGVNRSKFIFLEYGHVAYQIKWNHECSNVVANILPPPDPGGQMVKIQFFQNMVILLIKLKGNRFAATW